MVPDETGIVWDTLSFKSEKELTCGFPKMAITAEAGSLAGSDAENPTPSILSISNPSLVFVLIVMSCTPLVDLEFLIDLIASFNLYFPSTSLSPKAFKILTLSFTSPVVDLSTSHSAVSLSRLYPSISKSKLHASSSR